jgi:hypothetical protein
MGRFLKLFLHCWALLSFSHKLLPKLIQERYQLAEFYYRKALSIHPESAILMCHVAVVSR